MCVCVGVCVCVCVCVCGVCVFKDGLPKHKAFVLNWPTSRVHYRTQSHRSVCDVVLISVCVCVCVVCVCLKMDSPNTRPLY